MDGIALRTIARIVNDLLDAALAKYGNENTNTKWAAGDPERYAWYQRMYAEYHARLRAEAELATEKEKQEEIRFASWRAERIEALRRRGGLSESEAESLFAADLAGDVQATVRRATILPETITPELRAKLGIAAGEECSLVREEVAILQALQESHPAAMLQIEIAARADLERKTVGKYLGPLREKGLVKSAGERKGDTITPTGQRLISK